MWDILGIQATKEVKMIKKAYAKMLKENSPEENPEGFQALRSAYESALAYAKNASDEFYLQEGNETGAFSHLNETELTVEVFPEKKENKDSSFTSKAESDNEKQTWLQASIYASDFCDKLVDCFSVYQANQLINEFFKKDWFVSIDARYIFERCLIKVVAEKENDFNDEQFIVLLKNFGWTEQNHILWEHEYNAMQVVLAACQVRFAPQEVIQPSGKKATFDKTALFIIIIVITVAVLFSFGIKKAEERDHIQYEEYKELISRKQQLINQNQTILEQQLINQNKTILERGGTMPQPSIPRPIMPRPILKNYNEDLAPHSESFYDLDQTVKRHAGTYSD